ncbi:MAG: hypothetical protein Q9173_005756, partial [Seirophora scorigena]
ASQATPHVSTPVVTAHPVSSPQATIIHHFGPGWDHLLAHHPLPTTLATMIGEKRATPPLCVAGANCSQGSPSPENDAEVKFHLLLLYYRHPPPPQGDHVADLPSRTMNANSKEKPTTRR